MDQLRAVLRFLGYGNPQAPVWFVGLEEGLPAAADVAEHLLVRSEFPESVDCAAAHRALGIHHLHGLHGETPKVQSTWRQMSYLMLALEGDTKEDAGHRVAQYQAKHLGATAGRCFLAELMPLPRSRQDAWPYGELFADVWEKNRHYQRAVWPKRKNLLQDALARYAPKLVVFYGGGALARRRFDELVHPEVLENVPGTPFRVAHAPERVVLHVPHFSPHYDAFPRDDFLSCAIAAAYLAGLQLPL